MPEPVPPTGHLTRRADDFFLRHLGIGFEALAGPVDPINPAGLPARATSVYRAIIEARQGDDAALPRGVWQRQPKRADWPHVGNLAAGALRSQGKDLQLVAWLCEAQVHQHGVAALAPCLLLLHTLCERYWIELHPQPENGDAAGRADIVRWLDQKLAPTLRAAPLFAAGDGSTHDWAAWEQSAQPGSGDEPQRVALGEALAATPAAALSEQLTALTDALETISLTQQTFAADQGVAAPGLPLLTSQASAIAHALRAELEKRTPPPAPGAPADDQPPPAPTTATPRFRNRADAYACLAEAAAYLADVEPHSPTPYLVKRAVEWGNMNTGALYQELFIRLGGQLSIFDMVGSDMLTTPPPKPPLN